jgi:uncharacterized membrane protein
LTDVTEIEIIENIMFGLTKNNAASFSYMFFFFSGIFFFLFYKDPYVRFHAAQSTLIFVLLFAFQSILALLGIISSFSQLLGLLTFVLWLILIYKAWQGSEFELPFLGQIAHRLVGK